MKHAVIVTLVGLILATPAWGAQGSASMQTLPAGEASKSGTTAPGSKGCGSKSKCSEMKDCAEARYYLKYCGKSQLDRDGDGRPCESLCQ